MDKRTYRSMVEQYIYPYSNKSVVEVGCGNGAVTNKFSHEFAAWYAVDKDEKVLDEAKELKPETVKNVEYFCAYASKLPFENNSIDLVVFTNSFHFVKKRGSIKEAYRILKDNGILLIIEPHKYFGHPPLKLGSSSFDKERYLDYLKSRQRTIKFIAELSKLKWELKFHFVNDKTRIDLLEKV